MYQSYNKFITKNRSLWSVTKPPFVTHTNAFVTGPRRRLSFRLPLTSSDFNDMPTRSRSLPPPSCCEKLWTCYWKFLRPPPTPITLGIFEPNCTTKICLTFRFIWVYTGISISTWEVASVPNQWTEQIVICLVYWRGFENSILGKTQDISVKYTVAHQVSV